jgi:hypothetical protein
MNAVNKITFTFNLVIIGLLVAAIGHYAQLPHAELETEKQTVATELSTSSAQELRSFSELNSASDWPQWADQLRKQGVPTPVLARLAQAGFEEHWKIRQAQAKAALVKGVVDTTYLAVLDIQREREEEKEIRAALGDTEFMRYGMQIVLRSLPLHGITLTPSESEAIYEVEKKLQRLAQDLNEAKLKDKIDQTDYETQLQAAQAEHDQQFKALLGDQRYAAMYPPSNEADVQVRKDLRDVALPNDVTLEALVDIQKQWNERRLEAQNRLQDAKVKVNNCEDELQKLNSANEAEYERILGTNSLVASVKEEDARYKEMKRHAQDWSLDSAAMDYVFGTIQYYEKATANYQSEVQALEAKGETVDLDSIKKNLSQFADQSEQSLRSYLGQSRFEQLKNNKIIQFVQ